jgi:hypothetical protein
MLDEMTLQHLRKDGQDSSQFRESRTMPNGVPNRKLDGSFETTNGRPEWTRTIDLFRVKEAL